MEAATSAASKAYLHIQQLQSNSLTHLEAKVDSHPRVCLPNNSGGKYLAFSAANGSAALSCPLLSSSEQQQQLLLKSARLLRLKSVLDVLPGCSAAEAAPPH